MNKKIFLISIMLIVLCSLSAVSASEINGTDDSAVADIDVLSAPSSVVSTSEINSSDVNAVDDSDVLSESSASTTTVSTWSDLKSVCTDATQYDIIYVSGGITPPSTKGQISINKNIIIEGLSGSYIGGSSGSDVKTYNNYIPFYTTTSGLTITFKNLNFQNMNGNILMQFSGNGNYKIENCNFTNVNATGFRQSVVYLNYGELNITDSKFTNCVGMYGPVTNFYSSNSATANYARMNVNNCEFKNNRGTSEPGAINNCGLLNVRDSVFENNQAGLWAGAIHTHMYANTTIVNSTFKNNKAGYNGGALYTYSILNVYNSTFEGNNCTTNVGGGAIGASSYGSTYNVTINNCIFTNNRNLHSAGYGGAISAMDAGYFHLYYSTFINNSATTGKAIAVREGEYIDDNHTWDENVTLGNPVFGIAYNTFVDSEAHVNDANIAYVSNNASYIAAHNNVFYTPSEYANLGNNQQSTGIFADELLGLSLDDVEIIGDSQDTPQWSMDGFDSSNSMESPYSGISNGAIAWNYTGNTISSLSIDKDGRIILVNNGHLLYLYENGTFYSEALISSDGSTFMFFSIKSYSISPNNYFTISTEYNNEYSLHFAETDKSITSSGPTNYLIFTKTVGLNRNNTPLFADKNDGKVHILLDDGDMTLYNFNELIRDPNTQPYDGYASNIPSYQLSPIVTKSEIWVPTTEGIKIFSLNAFVNEAEVSPIKTISDSLSLRPSADANGNVYFFTSDSISKADTTGVLKTQAVTGGIGSRMAVSTTNNALYSVNALGTLYKYSLEDLTETELTDIGSTASTIMTDANGIIYVGSDDGKFYAFDDEGNKKWMVDTESASAVKNCAMDNEGNIYFYTAENKVYAINEVPIALKNLTIEVTVPEGEFTTMDNVTITATLNETTEGNVTFTVGDLTKTVNITGNVAEWTTKLPGGNQTITATFGGNDEFATATNTTDVEISKVDVEFVNVPEKVNMDDYTSFEFNLAYNNTIAVVKSDNFKVYKDDEELELYNGYDLYGDNGNFNLDLWEFNSGKYNMTIAFAGDDSYNPVNITFALNVVPHLSVNSKVDEDKITVNVNVGDSVYPHETISDATGKFTVTTNNETLAEGTIDQGTGSVSFNKLEPGTYELIVAYEGDDNYLGNNVTISLFVPKTSQWAVTGYDYKNSGKSNYTRLDNVAIIWVNNQTVNFNNNPLSDDFGQFIPSYSAVIDSDGVIYITDGKSVYALNDDGTLKYSTEGTYNGGLSLMYDFIVLDSVTINAIRIFNSSSRANLVGDVGWSTSSRFPAAIGPDGRVYITSTYGDNMNTGKWIVVLKYENGKFSYDTGYYEDSYTGSSRGNYDLTKVSGTPVFTDDGIMWVSTPGSIGAASISNGNVLFSSMIGVNGRPVVDDSNIVYYLGVDNTIHALTLEGYKWNTTVNGTIGTTLAVDNENGFLYAVNGEGELYKYDINDNGAESYVADVGSAGQSIIIDGKGNVYVSTTDGDVYAFNSNYQYLWNINLGSSITGQMAMDKNGVIYVFTSDALYALGYKNETTLDINTEDNYTVFDNITVTVNTNASGNISYELYLIETDEDNIYNSFIAGDVIAIDDGTATINLGNLAEGNYQLNVIYPDNQDYYVYAFNTTSFNVNKIETEITPEIDIEESTITLTFPENATGVVYVDVNGTGYYAEIKDNEAVFTIKGLEPGEEYFVNITYPGDENFTALNTNVTISVPQLLDPELELSVEDTIITVSINDTTTGIVIVTVGDISFAFDSDDEIVLDASEYLENGTYDVTVEYLGDENFLAASANDTVTVPAEPIVEPKDPELKATAENTTVTVNVNKDATGGVIVDIDGTSYYAEIKDGQAIIDVKGLEAGKDYTATVIYTGDENFTEDETTVKISVPKEEEIEPEDASMTVDSTNSTITVELPEDATGYVLVDIDGKGYYAKVTDGKATVDVAGLDAGNYTATVTYTGDDNYKANTSSVAVSIPEEDEPIPEPVTPEMTVKVTNTTIEVTLPKDATGNVLVDVNGQGYYAPVKDGKATVNVIGLDEGTYPATVTYAGDDKYTNASKPASVTVPEDEEPTPEPVDPKADINVSDDAVNVELPKDATGYVLVDVDGKGYYAPVKDGKATVDLPELAPGNHTVTVTYTGDDKYKPATANKTVTVEKEIITVVSENLTKIEKAPDRFEAVFTDSDGNALANKDVTFGLNGITYTRTTDANGKAGMNINLVPGTYTIKTTNPVTNESATNTITVLPRFTEDSDLVKYFRNDSQYVLKVLDDNGNPAKAGEIVTYNINGVFYNRTTNATGHVKLNINLPPDTYIITAEYKGCKVAHTVKVLPTLTGSDITKKYGQAGAYEAKLVDGQGKAYANQKIEFNINGVMYQRTTNADGVAKLNINLQAGKYIITASYGQARISNTVTVTA